MSLTFLEKSIGASITLDHTYFHWQLTYLLRIKNKSDSHLLAVSKEQIGPCIRTHMDINTGWQCDETPRIHYMAWEKPFFTGWKVSWNYYSAHWEWASVMKYREMSWRVFSVKWSTPHYTMLLHLVVYISVYDRVEIPLYSFKRWR